MGQKFRRRWHLGWLAAGIVWLAAVMPAHSRPGQGIRLGDLILHPFVDGSATYDSNVYLDPTNQESDIFLEGLAGIDFDYGAEGGSQKLNGRGFIILRNYFNLTTNDFDNYGERMTYRAGTPDRVTVAILQSYRLIDDYDRSTYYGESAKAESHEQALTYDRSMRLRRTLNDFGVVLGRNLTDRTTASAGANYSLQDYSSTNLYDVTRKTAQLGVSRRLTDKTSAIGNLQYGLEDNPSYPQEAQSLAARVGLDTRPSEKVHFSVGLGMERYARQTTTNLAQQAAAEGDAALKPSGAGDDQGFSFDIAGGWIATTKLEFELAARNGFQSAPQYFDTANRVTVVSVSTVYHTTETLDFSLTGSYRQDDYLDLVPEENRWMWRQDDRWAALLRGDYTPRSSFLTVYVEGGYEYDVSTVDVYNYDQLRLAIGLSLRY